MTGGSTGEVATTGRWTWTDLRLVPAAGVVWLVVLAGPRITTGGLVGLAACAVLVALSVRRYRTARARVLLAVLAALAVAAGMSAVRSAAREASPLVSAARAGSSAEVVLSIDGAARTVRGKGASRVVIPGTLRRFRIGNSATDVREQVLVFAPLEGWSRLVPGTTVRGTARMVPSRTGETAGATLSARGRPVVVSPPDVVHRAAAAVRDDLAAASARVLDGPSAGLLPGLVVGDTSRMDPVVAEDFRRAGLSHLTAVSGANVAVVLSGVLWPLRRRSVGRRGQAVAAAAALCGFVVLAGPEASVLRAAVMGAVSLLSLATGRPRAAVPALAAAVVLLLLAEPRLATDVGFGLSVAATAAIVLLAPRWSRALRARRVPSLLADALSVSAAAGLATAPLVAAISGQVPLVSLPANLVAAPAVAPATVLGLLAALAAAVVRPAGDALVWLAGWPVRWLVGVGRYAAAVPDAALRVPAGAGWALLLAACTAGAALAVWRFRPLRLVGLAAVVGVVALGWPLRQLVRGWPPPQTLLVACDVGQGDALVVPTGAGAGLLVDTGPDVGPVDQCLRRLHISTLPLVLLSHLDADHAGGLAGALAGRTVGVVATGALSPADTRVSRIDLLAAGAGAERTEVKPGSRLHVGAATVEILAPPSDTATASARPNDLSVLARVTVRGVRILFTGDLSAAAEARILARGVDVRADVLKVPHHGSADTDPRFLAATRATVAVISVGADNDYGHPTAKALAWLARDGMWVHRTDLEGDLAVAGTAGDWGVSWLGGGSPGTAPAASVTAIVPGHHRGGGPAVVAAGRVPSATPANGRHPVTPCRRGRRTSASDIPAPGRRGGGGAAALACRRRRAGRRPRPPPGRSAARADRVGTARPGARRGARPVAVRHAPSGRRHRRPGGRRRAGRGAPRLCQGSGSGRDVGAGALRREAERGAHQGIRRRGGRRGRVPEGLLGGRPDRVRP